MKIAESVLDLIGATPLVRLRRLPKPVGIMACNDARGHQLLNAARQAEMVVPEEVAVVGVDNYRLICELAEPSLSSVEQNTRQIAQTAVAVLENMLAGRRAPAAPIVVKPCRLVTRRSSDAGRGPFQGRAFLV